MSAHAAEGRARAAIATAHPLATKPATGYWGRAAMRSMRPSRSPPRWRSSSPYSAGLGGGGFWLLHRASRRNQVMIDARETAPAGVALSMYVDSRASRFRARPCAAARRRGFPACPRAWCISRATASCRCAQRSRRRSRSHATDSKSIRVTRESPRCASAARRRREHGARISRNGAAPPQATCCVSRSSRATLEAIARRATPVLPRPVAQAYRVAGSTPRAACGAGGSGRLQVIERRPLDSDYRGATIVTARCRPRAA